MPILCAAPRDVPRPLANGTLLSLILFIRHGTRAPVSHCAGWPAPRGEWYCGTRYHFSTTRTPVANGVPLNFTYDPTVDHDYGPTCKAGDLIDEGYDQLVKLGTAYRSYLIGNKVAPPDYDTSRIKVRSSWIKRTAETATAFLHGLYPPKANGEVVNVETGTTEFDALAPLFDRDKEFADLLPSYLVKPPLSLRIELSKEKLTPLFDLYDIPNRSDFDYLHLGDLFFPYRCGNGELSDGVTDDLLALMLGNLVELEKLYASVTTNTSVRPLNDLLLKEIEFLRQSDTPNFSLISTHDVTFVSFLVGIGYFGLKVPPPLASHLAIEIWDQGEKYGRVVLNGKVVPIGRKELTPLDAFLDLLAGKTTVEPNLGDTKKDKKKKKDKSTKKDKGQKKSKDL